MKGEIFVCVCIRRSWRAPSNQFFIFCCALLASICHYHTIVTQHFLSCHKVMRGFCWNNVQWKWGSFFYVRTVSVSPSISRIPQLLLHETLRQQCSLATSQYSRNAAWPLLYSTFCKLQTIFYFSPTIKIPSHTLSCIIQLLLGLSWGLLMRHIISYFTNLMYSLSFFPTQIKASNSVSQIFKIQYSDIPLLCWISVLSVHICRQYTQL